ncbi:MAG: hypothetical protein JNL38_16415 [Myxococcales bacterium]|jgi:hypothetical protein|nr:hypothetical protein [Myxococcales bacterium]
MLEWLFGARAKLDGEGVVVDGGCVAFAEIVDAVVEDGGVALLCVDGTRRLARVPAAERPAFAAAVLASLGPASGSVYRTAARETTTPTAARPHAKRKARPGAAQAAPLRWPRGLS